MGGISNLLLVVFNVITTFFGVAIAGLGAWLATKDSETCLQFLHSPILVFGVFIAAVSVVALISAFFKIGILLRIYLLLMLVLILACVAFAIFSFVVTHKNYAKVLANVNYKQYRIGDYSEWLQKQVENPATWKRIRSCLSDSKMCFFSYMSSTALLSNIVNYLALDTYKGCCIPPDVCQYSLVNGAYVSPANAGADADCTTFSNNADTRCFDCDACPAGVMESVVTNWQKLAIGVAVVAGALLVIYCVGCQAL
ncbi:hypothetical protein L7F22_034462 [Adiantum nelumboides]|nr:hypothetical protein [Adiantum nelumboides]